VALIPNSLLEKNAKELRNFTIMVCLASIVVLFGAGLAISRYFSKRVTKIVSFLRVFREGDFRKRIQFSGKDEFAQIAAALNEMGGHIETLIQEVYVSNLRKKEAELSSLQSQINPHFLYNTLSSISRLAKFGEISKLDEMVRGLAKFYRLTLNEGRTLISIDEELQQAKSYIDIQKIKHEDRLQIAYDIDPQVLGHETVKIIVQPFIENVLEHALYSDRIHIRIAAALEAGRIELRIIDDGVGMPAETIERVFAPDGIGYGIRNVDQRIKLQFGDPYGVSIHSRPGIGTSVRVAFPAIPWDERKESRQ